MGKDRYRRQILVKEVGQKGQKTLALKHAILIGGGGLGSNSANLLIRMGIGSMDIIDYDTIDKTNLHRTSVFSEQDVGKYKALVLKEKLQSVNTDVHVKGINKKVTSKNIESLIHNADVIIDGTDNIPLRLLINEKAIKHKIPWVYAGVYETVGMVMAILPKKTACLHCITPTIPTPKTTEIPVLGSLPATIAAIQCNEAIKILLGKHKIPWVYAGVYETVGMVMAILPKKTACLHCITPTLPAPKTKEIPVLGSLPATIATIQCNEAIKILLGKQPAGLIIYDVWNQCFDLLDIKRNPCCPICGKK